jgi:hypothetical protein
MPWQNEKALRIRCLQVQCSWQLLLNPNSTKQNHSLSAPMHGKGKAPVLEPSQFPPCHPFPPPRIYPTTPRFALALPGKRGQGNNRLPPDDEGPAASFTVSWMSNHSAPLDIPKPASVDDFVKNGKKKKVSGSSRRPAIDVKFARAMWLISLVFPMLGFASPSCPASSARKGGAPTRSCSRGGKPSSVRADALLVSFRLPAFLVFACRRLMVLHCVSADLGEKCVERMELPDDSPAVRKSFSGNV